MNNLRRGFTLIEMMMVMVLVGVIMAVAIPFLRKPKDAASVDSAMNTVAAMHAVAKSVAVQRGRTAWLVLNASGGTAWVVVRKAGSSTAMDTIGKVENLNTRYGVTFTTNDDSLTFSPRGIGMDAGTVTMVFTRGSNTDTLTATATGRLVR